MNKIIIFIFKLYVNITAAIMTVTFLGVIITSIPLLSNNGKSYCIIVNNESDFIGKYLKVNKYKEKIYDDTKNCIDLDQRIDDNNGKKLGKVRWVECSTIDNDINKCKILGDY